MGIVTASKTYNDLHWQYMEKGIDIAPALKQVEQAAAPEGEYWGTEDRLISMAVRILKAFLKQATRKPPTTVWGKIIRYVFG